MKSLSDTAPEEYLDGLRGLAALMVLAHHLLRYLHTPFQDQNILMAIDYGHMGVSLFFLVSAFTLTRAWEQRDSRSFQDIRDFYIRRAFRILPFWWINVAFAVWYLNPSWQAILANVFMYFSFFSYDPNFMLVPYGWSIGVEETFYVLFPIWMLYCRSWVNLVLLLAGFIFAADWWTQNAHVLRPGPSAEEYVFGFPLASYYCFFLGVFAYKVTRAQNLQKLLRPHWSIVLLLELGIFWVFLNMSSLTSLKIHFTFMLLLILVSQKRGIFYRILSFKPLTKIGICCYSFYLLHYWVLEYYREYRYDFLNFPIASVGELEYLILLPFMVLATFAVSALSFFLIERPSVILGRKFLNTRRTDGA